MEYKIFNGQIMDLMKMLHSDGVISYSKGYRSFFNTLVQSDTAIPLRTYKKILKKLREKNDGLASTEVILFRICVENITYIIQDDRDERILLSYYGSKYNSSLIMDKEPERETVVVSANTRYNHKEYKDVMMLKNLFEYNKEERYLRINASPLKEDAANVLNKFHRYQDILRDYLGIPSEKFGYNSMNIRLKEQKEPEFTQPRLTRQMFLLGEMVYHVFKKDDRYKNKDKPKNFNFMGCKDKIIINKISLGDFKVLGHQNDVQDFIDSGDFHNLYDERFLISLDVLYLDNGLVLLALYNKPIKSQYAEIRNKERQEYYQNKGMIIHDNKISKIVDMGDVSSYRDNNLLTDKEKISHSEFREMLEKI